MGSPGRIGVGAIGDSRNGRQRKQNSNRGDADRHRETPGILSKPPAANHEPDAAVQRINSWIRQGRSRVSFLKRLLGKDEPPKPRVRVCVECGMPVAEHKDWCSILRGQAEMQRRAQESRSTT
jgi:hypothetical protein